MSGHSINFGHSFDRMLGDVISRQEVCDAIDLLFEGPDATFTIVTPMTRGKAGTRATCMSLGGDRFVLTFFRKTINIHFDAGMSMGGNRKCESLKEAIMSILAHEVQHANQNYKHKKNRAFWSGKYRSRPCERDARSFADSKEDLISTIMGSDVRIRDVLPASNDDPVSEIFEVFSSQDEIVLDDVVEELRTAGAYNPINVGEITHRFVEAGKKIV